LTTNKLEEGIKKTEHFLPPGKNLLEKICPRVERVAGERSIEKCKQAGKNKAMTRVGKT